jgi:mercuric ion binding protein
MKTQVLLLASCLFFSFASIAQGKKSTQSDNIKVWGNCGMCKTTIEKAAKSAGVLFASWSEETKVLNVKYNTAKTDNAKIQKAIAAAGYDTQDEYASDEAYNSLHGCCQYERKPKPATTTENKSLTDSSSCCKKDSTGKADHAKCSKDAGHDKKEACTSHSASCKHDDAKKDCCKKDKDAKEAKKEK